MNVKSRLVGRLRSVFGGHLTTQIEDLKVLLGKTLADQHASSRISQSLAESEFKVFSQFGEDGIIEHLLSLLPEIPRSFIEFGVEDYTESNTRFLLRSRNWRGLVIDGDRASVRSIRTSGLYWQHDLTAMHAFITRDNINDLIVSSRFDGPLGLLSIDIDGNDYWIWEAINTIDPVIVVIEYNALWGAERRVTTPYRYDFDRARAHYSMLFFGASLAALEGLGRIKGYVLVGCNSHGTNAFFVRTDMAGAFKSRTVKDAFVGLQVRQSRDPSGNLTYLSRIDSADLISHLTLIDLDSDAPLSVGDFLFDE